MRTALFLFTLLATTFAGCLESAESVDGPSVIDSGLPALHGWVLDQALVPIPGVELQANVGNQTLDVLTNADGFYGFDDVPADQTVVLIARAEGYHTQSKQTTVPVLQHVQINFTMEPVPVITPYHTAIPFKGNIQCQYNVGGGESTFRNECGPGNNENQWTFSVGPDFAGGVVEIEWDSNTAASAYFHATLVCATPGQCGDDIQPFTDAVGESRLRLEIGQLHAQKWFPQGGQMMLTVTVDPNNEAQEAQIGGAFAVNQQFEAIASVFYHAPPPPGYSVDA